MKILHVIPNLNKGGAERLCLDICRELIKHDQIEVQIITFSPTNDFQFLSAELNVHVIPSKVQPSIKGKMIVEVENLENHIKSLAPDIIHAHLFESVMVLSQVQWNKAKYIIHFHDNMNQFSLPSLKKILKKSTWTNWFERRIILKNFANRNTSFIGISENTVKYMNTVLPNRAKIFYLKNAVDLSRFEKIKHQVSTPPALTIIGSLVEKKGQSLAIETIAYLKNNKTIVQLHICGDGPLKSELIKLANELNVSEQIHFHGNVDKPEQFLSQSFAYIHTATYEPFGLVIVEAMACGLPIVCTDGYGNRDLIQEGINGFMIWERKIELLADKIQFLLENEEERKRMGENAALFAQNFGMDNYVKQLIEIYKN